MFVGKLEGFVQSDFDIYTGTSCGTYIELANCKNISVI